VALAGRQLGNAGPLLRLVAVDRLSEAVARLGDLDRSAGSLTHDYGARAHNRFRAFAPFITVFDLTRFQNNARYRFTSDVLPALARGQFDRLFSGARLEHVHHSFAEFSSPNTICPGFFWRRALGFPDADFPTLPPLPCFGFRAGS